MGQVGVRYRVAVEGGLGFMFMVLWSNFKPWLTQIARTRLKFFCQTRTGGG